MSSDRITPTGLRRGVLPDLRQARAVAVTTAIAVAAAVLVFAAVLLSGGGGCSATCSSARAHAQVACHTASGPVCR
jgi:hypothetical protein